MKKISRRDFLKAAGIGAAAMGLTACGGSSSSTAAPASSAASDPVQQITLRVADWSDSTKPYRDAFHEKFQAANPDIKVEYTQLTIDQFNSTVVTAISGGDAPDLFPIPTNLNLTVAINEDWFLDMKEYVSQGFIDSFMDGMLVDGVHSKDGILYCVPEAMSYTNSLFYYNKDILAETGLPVPTNFEEFRAACKAATEKGYYGLIEGATQTARCDVMLRALCQGAGGKISIQAKALTVDGRVPYDTAEMFKAVDLLQGIVDDGSLHPDTASINAPTARELFAQGQALFLMQGLWCIGPWAASNPELNYGVMMPLKDSDNGYLASTEMGSWMGIYKQTKYPEQAARYLEALYSDEYGFQAAVVQAGGQLSPIKGINDVNVTNPIMKEYYEGIKACIDIPVATNRNAKFWEFYGAVVAATPSLAEIASGILSGAVADPKAALKTLSDAETKAWQDACTVIGADFAELEFANWTAGVPYTAEDYAAL